jgi:hypothetical protein
LGSWGGGLHGLQDTLDGSQRHRGGAGHRLDSAGATFGFNVGTWASGLDDNPIGRLVVVILGVLVVITDEATWLLPWFIGPSQEDVGAFTAPGERCNKRYQHVLTIMMEQLSV